jgi:tetratricopeptide (TPR) repeat protein
VLLSPDALASDWVPREMSIAYWQHVKLGKRLLPLMYRTCELPPDWQLIQALRFTDELPYDERLTRLLRDLGYAGPITTVSLTAQPALANGVASTATLDIAKTPLTPKERLVARLIQEVHTAFGRENWRQVLLRAQTLQDEAPEAMTPLLWRELGLAALELKQGDIALAAFNNASTDDPYDVPTIRAKAQTHVLLKQYHEATKLLERAQSYIPMDEAEPQLALLTELIDLLRRQRRWKEALVVCERALSLDPQSAFVWANKANALSFLKRSDEALEACERALALDENNAVVGESTGNVLYNVGSFPEALAAYERTIALDPAHAS